VVVYDLEKIRTNEIFQAQIKMEAFEPLAAKYRVVGSLGMSDVLNTCNYLVILVLTAYSESVTTVLSRFDSYQLSQNKLRFIFFKELGLGCHSLSVSL
jgi:hypothetical protein